MKQTETYKGATHIVEMSNIGRPAYLLEIKRVEYVNGEPHSVICRNTDPKASEAEIGLSVRSLEEARKEGMSHLIPTDMRGFFNHVRQKIHD